MTRQALTDMQESTQTIGGSAAFSEWLQELQQKTLWSALPGLGVVALVILGSIGRFRTPVQTMLTAAMAVVLAGIIWKVRQWHYLAAAWLLVLGSMVLDLYVVVESDLDLALMLLAIPVGLATLTISRAAGAITAISCTAGLLFAPPTLITPAPPVLVITLMLVWGTFGMLWLTLNPLLTAVAWAWTSYEHSHTLLEQARDTQVRLQQTLEDLADANLQLTRLNRQAQGLRQIAEDERRAKQEFVANVSHELRTPLNMIVGFCEMMTKLPQSYGDVPPALLSDLDVVLRNGQHLSNLVDDVLDMSQIEAGQMALTKERVTVPDLVNAVTIAVRPLFVSKGLYLETEIPDELPAIFCDRTRIREVLLNLLSNAGRFTEQGGVHVRAWQEDLNLIISVQDTGPGIAEKDQERLFRPFQQVDTSVKRRYGGTGLGLSISKNFVELHGGQMWLESQAGHGTTFFFSLPIDPPALLDSSPARWITPGWEFLQRTHPVRSTSPSLHPRLVVVEEGNIIQRLLDRYLGDSEIITSPDLEGACQELAQTPAQALVLNTIHIGTTLQQLNEHGAALCDIPIFICTVPGVAQAANGLGVNGYLVKPISQQALLDALDGLNREVKTVLVVDDEPDALRLFRRMLMAGDRGYRVMRAANGQQAWARLQQESVDVLLLDLMMPDMNGFELLALKNEDATLRDIPVILISARDPLGQPIISNALAVTRPQGLSTRDVLACIEALQAILSPVRVAN